jgi:formate hydrogenlyase transcriptional activator
MLRGVLGSRASEWQRELLAQGDVGSSARWAPGPRPIETLKAAARTHILKALEACRWQVSGKGGAAELLGLRPSTLDFRMKKPGITRPA